MAVVANVGASVSQLEHASRLIEELIREGKIKDRRVGVGLGVRVGSSDWKINAARNDDLCVELSA